MTTELAATTGGSAAQAPSGPVLYVLKRFPRLSETFILRELLELEARGCRVLVDALLTPEDGPRHPELDRLGAEVRWLGRDRRADWPALVAERALRSGVRHLHAHFASAAAEVARDAAGLAGLPFTVTTHAKDMFHRDHAPHLAGRLAGAAGVVTVSRFNVAHLRTVLPAGTPIHHVPNGVAPVDQCGPNPAGPVLCVSRLVAKKGIDTLIEAAPRLPHLAVEIIGGGPLAAELAQLAELLGVADRVRFLGAQPSPAVDAAYRRAAMVVLPCRIAPDGDRDGLPTVLTEALARGLPVVAGAVVGIPELVRHRRTGLLVPPDDPAALAKAIGELAACPARAAQLGAAGRRLVGEEYSPAASATRLLEVFG